MNMMHQPMCRGMVPDKHGGIGEYAQTPQLARRGVDQFMRGRVGHLSGEKTCGEGQQHGCLKCMARGGEHRSYQCQNVQDHLNNKKQLCTERVGNRPAFDLCQPACAIQKGDAEHHVDQRRQRPKAPKPAGYQDDQGRGQACEGKQGQSDLFPAPNNRRFVHPKR